MNICITELSGDSWSIVLRFGDRTVTAFSDGFPSSEQLDTLQADVKASVKRKES